MFRLLSKPRRPRNHPSARRGADDVGPGDQVVGDVISLIVEVVSVARPAWRQDMVADPTSIDLHLIYAVSCRIEPCQLRRILQFELARR